MIKSKYSNKIRTPMTEETKRRVSNVRRFFEDEETQPVEGEDVGAVDDGAAIDGETSEVADAALEGTAEDTMSLGDMLTQAADLINRISQKASALDPSIDTSDDLSLDTDADVDGTSDGDAIETPVVESKNMVKVRNGKVIHLSEKRKLAKINPSSPAAMATTPKAVQKANNVDVAAKSAALRSELSKGPKPDHDGVISNVNAAAAANSVEGGNIVNKTYNTQLKRHNKKALINGALKSLDDRNWSL